MYEVITRVAYKEFGSDKEMLDFSNYSTKSKYSHNSNKLMVGKIKDSTAGIAIEEFVELKLNMYSYLVDDNSERKRAKSGNKNVVATISHNEYKVLLNKKCLRHSMNKIQSKSHRIETYGINKIYLFCVNDKI